MKKEVITIPKEKDFFEGIKELLGGKVENSWIFINESIVNHVKKNVGAYWTDTVNRRMSLSYDDKSMSIQYCYKDVWHRVLLLKAEGLHVQECKDPDEIFFIALK